MTGQAGQHPAMFDLVANCPEAGPVFAAVAGVLLVASCGKPLSLTCSSTYTLHAISGCVVSARHGSAGARRDRRQQHRPTRGLRVRRRPRRLGTLRLAQRRAVIMDAAAPSDRGLAAIVGFPARATSTISSMLAPSKPRSRNTSPRLYKILPGFTCRGALSVVDFSRNALVRQLPGGEPCWFDVWPDPPQPNAECSISCHLARSHGADMSDQPSIPSSPPDAPDPGADAPPPVFAPYNPPAGGWGALRATARALREQSVELKGSRALLSMNQPDGFDCPGCAPIRGIRAPSSFAKMAPRPSLGS